MVVEMRTKMVSTKGAVVLEAIKRNAADRLCSVVVFVCVRFGHKTVFVCEPAIKDSISTWYAMDYSNFDIIRDICSVAFDVANIDASVSDIDGFDVYRITGIRSED